MREKLRNAVRARPAAAERFFSYMQILIGCVIGAAAYPLFMTPNRIAPGGVTGIATILNHLFCWPVGTVSLILNMPLFVIGYKAMGRIFVFRSFIATILFSVLIDLLPLKPMTNDPLLGTLYGGVMLGAGLGIIMRGGYTGTERPTLLCVISRSEIMAFKRILREIDENAFVIITEAHEAIGDGFTNLRDSGAKPQ